MKTTLFLMALCIGFLGYSVWGLEHSPNFGATLTQTASSDTLNTLRTNVNTAFTTLGTQLTGYNNLFANFSTTTNNIFTGTNSFAANTATFGTIAGTIINTGTFKQGSTGTTKTGENFGTCNAWSNANTIAASTTVTIDCGGGTKGQTALTGVTAGDNTTLQFGTTTSTTYEGLRIIGQNASTTQGFITLKLFNGTGTTFTWTSAASSSFMYTARR